jgi:hypothetical protein
MCGGMAAGAAGVFISGHIGDELHRRSPFVGRIYAAQASVAMGIAIQVSVFTLLPTSKPNQFYTILCILILFNFVGVWAATATNAPLIADIVPKESRSSAYSFFCSMQSVPSAFAGYLVAFIASAVFGFEKNNSGIAGHAHSEQDVGALTSALLWITVIPWSITLVLYTCLHYTYVGDLLDETAADAKVKDKDDEQVSLLSNKDPHFVKNSSRSILVQ